MSKTDTTIDQDLYDGLQQARKKKPRYFALIAKGADVVGLIVQKKVINDGAAQKAKSECKGTLVIQGVCCGEGVELKFEVEGEEPSILPKKIKDFIEEQTDLTLKPQWVAVQKLSSVQDDEGQPATDQAPASQPAAVEPVIPPAPPPGPAAPVDVKALQARLKELLTRQRDLFAKNPAFREKFLKFSQPATSLTMSGSADAPAALDKLEQALNIAERGTQQPAPSAPPPPASTASEPQASEPTTGEPKASDPAAEWKQKLAAWLPAIKAAIEAKGPTSAEIGKLLAQASSLSKPGGDMALAIEKLAECHGLATGATDQAAATSQESTSSKDGDLEEEWSRRVMGLEPRVLEAKKNRAGDANWMAMFMNAQDLGDDRQYEKSFAILDKIEALLDAPTKERSPELIAALNAWNAARYNAVKHLQAEIDAIVAENKQALVEANAADPSGSEAQRFDFLANAAELALRAVMKQLAGKVETAQQAQEMKAYLDKDETVAEVCELATDIKLPLVGTLEALISA